MTFLRNNSGIVRAKLEAQVALNREHDNQVQLKQQVNQQRTLTDSLQAQIETLYTMKANLQSNKTALGKADIHPVYGVQYKMVSPTSSREHML